MAEGGLDELEQLLGTGGIFAGFDAEEIQAVARVAERRSIARGEALRRDGDTDAAFFVVTAGKLSVTRQVAGEEVPIETLKVGYSYGAISMVTGRPATTDVVATSDSHVLAISRAGLDRLFAEQPEIAGRFWHNLANVLARRLAKTNELVTEYVSINQRLIEDPEFLRFYSQL